MMNEHDSAHIRDLLISIASGIERQVTDAIERSHSYAAIYKIVPFPDGDQWCVLLGANLQDGIAGFGPTPHAAIMDFDRQMFNAKAAPVPPAVKESLTTAAPAAVPQPSVANGSNAYEFGLGLLKGVIDRNVAHNPEYAAKVQAEYDWIVTVLRMYEAAPLENRKILTVLRYLHSGRLVGSPTYRNSSLYDEVVSAMATLAGMSAEQKGE